MVSLDELRDELQVDAADDQGEVIQVARERCRQLLRMSRSFAFNATNILRQTRRRWIDLFADYDARIELVYIEPPMRAVLEQNARWRSRPVPEKVIQELAEKCEPPTISESHELTTVCCG